MGALIRYWATALLCGSMAMALGASEAPAAEGLPLERPMYFERAITPADLEGRSLRELALMRNWIFARAGNPFRREWLRDFFEPQPWYRAAEVLDPTRLTTIDRGNAEALARHELSMSRPLLVAMRERLLGRDLLSDADRIELDLLGERLGEWRAPDSAEEPSPLQNPILLERRLTLDQLADFSRRDLALLRNLIYARRGRPFESEWLKLYFMRFDWYRSDPRYSDRRLTAIDRRNLRLVRGLEKELGGPLSEGSGIAWFA